MMRKLVVGVSSSLLLGLLLVVGAGCPGAPTEICGQSTELPDIEEGFGKATRSDGVAFEEEGTWAAAPSSSVVIGVLTMIIANDDEGLVVDDLISDGAFPICVPQAARSETAGAANFVDGGFVTDDTNKGGLAILGKDGDVLIGRFSFDMAAPGGDTLSFDDGVFRLPQR